MTYQTLIRTFPNFPKEGINFIDWLPIMSQPEAFNQLIDELANLVADWHFTKILALESRGFLLGVPLAHRLNVGFAPIRKKGKLPGPCIEQTYALEYAESCIEIQADAVTPEDSVLIVDDLLATGGSMQAANELVARITPHIQDLCFIELTDIYGRDKLTYPFRSLLKMTEN